MKHLICFGKKVTDSSETHGVGEPALPRLPKKYEDGNAMCEIHNERKTYFRQQYYEAIDLAINCIKDRFQQPVYCQLENLVSQ